MKAIKVIVLIVMLSLYLGQLGVRAVFAHDGEEHAAGSHDHSANDSESLSLNGILLRIHSEQQALSQSIGSKALSDVHGRSEAISALAKSLLENVPAEDKEKTVGLINNVIRAADALHASADKNDQNGAEANLRKLESLIKLLDARFKFKPDEIALNRSQTTYEQSAQHPHGEKCTASDVTVNIVSKQYAFEPSLVKVKQGQKVCLKLSSEDVEHGIMIEDYQVHVHGTPQVVGEVQFVANKRGEFNFLCHQSCGTGHADMKGKLIVE